MTPDEFRAHRARILVTLGIGLFAMLAAWLADYYLPLHILTATATLFLLVVAAYCVGKAWLMARTLRGWRVPR
jgi:hypothetical protein